jgi:hypothetical protein
MTRPAPVLRTWNAAIGPLGNSLKAVGQMEVPITAMMMTKAACQEEKTSLAATRLRVTREMTTAAMTETGGPL